MKLNVAKRIFFGISFVLLAPILFGGVEPFLRNSITGATIAPTATFVNYDPVFYLSNGTATSVNPADYHIYRATNTIQLEVNQATVKDCPT